MGNLVNEHKVLIIGAGIAGLALAQILRNNGITFEIFERDDGNRSQGWLLGLDECLPDLLPLLPKDIGDIRLASPNRNTGRPDSWAFVNPRTYEIQGISGEGTGSVMVDRNLLRNLWMKSVQVQHNKYFTSYTLAEHSVTINFRDGSAAQGTLLVGADGSNSRVRAQLLDGFEATPSRAIMLNGTVELSKGDWTPLLEHGSGGVLFGEPGLKGNVLLGEYLKDERALMNWNLAWLSADIDSDLNWTRNASGDALFEKARQLASHLPSYIRETIDKTGPEGMQRPPLRLLETVLPHDELPAGPVTLVGDAAHSMVPFRGMGANTALLDVCDLAKAIIANVRSQLDVDHLLRNYEKKMISRGRKKVFESREVAESDRSFDVSGGRLAQFKQNEL